MTRAQDVIKRLSEKKILVRKTINDLDPNKEADGPLITDVIVKSLINKGWLSRKDVDEFAIFYQEGEFHLFGSDPVGWVANRYKISEKTAKDLLKYMDANYKKFRGDKH